MKKSTILLILICQLGLAGSLFGQQAMKQKIEMKLDELGNADIILSMSMNASQWSNWNATLGNNPAALKREVERGMPAFFLDNFQLEKDEMNRSFQLSLNAYGVCKVDKRGQWILETDAKDADLTEISPSKYMYVESPGEFGGQVQQTYFVEFPPEARNIEIEEDAFGKTIFTFDMRGPGGRINFSFWGGLLLLLGGGAWMGAGLLQNRKPDQPASYPPGR